MYFDDTPYALQTSGNPYSFNQTGSTYRFEVHAGDKGREGDGVQERAEISSQERLDFDQTYTMTYDFMVEPGEKNTVGVNLGQFHGTPDAGDYGSLGPVFAIRLVGERMRIVTRTDSEWIIDGRPADNTIYSDATDIERGRWYQMKVEIRFDPDGQGIINVWRDGEQLAHYTGGVGYNDAIGPYWKMGIYRPPAPETLAVSYRNFDLVEGGAGTPSDPTPTLPDSDDPLVLRAGDEGASLTGGAASERLIGGDGVDILRGGAGNDTLTGGAEFDDVHGNMGDDLVLGGDGGDWVVGGKDQDLLFGEAGDDVVLGNLGDDTCDGGAGGDWVRGGQGDDIVFGGDGDDWLAGDRGSDTLTGGTGADIFHTWSEAGLDQLLDFNIAEGDRVNLLPGTAYSLVQSGADIVIDMGSGQQMVLVGVQLATLPAGWIFTG